MTRAAAKSATTDAPTEATETENPMITERQMRQLHALLRDHGITGDKGIHDWLSVYLDRDVESRKELTQHEAATVIAHLEATPPGANRDTLNRLRATFPDEAIGKLPRSTCRDCSNVKSGPKVCGQHKWTRCQVCGNGHSSASMHIDFVGHADVTARLLEVDPFWTWRPFTAEEIAGIPPTLRDGLWINLTICGVTRPGFGDTENGKGPKEAIGDALRNAAMRFGVALDLWAKGDREWAHSEKHGAEMMAPDEAPPRQSSPPRQEPPPVAPLPMASNPGAKAATEELVNELMALARWADTDLAGITAKWRAHHGDIPVATLYDVDPMALAPLVDAIREYQAEQEGENPEKTRAG